MILLTAIGAVLMTTIGGWSWREAVTAAIGVMLVWTLTFAALLLIAIGIVNLATSR